MTSSFTLPSGHISSVDVAPDGATMAVGQIQTEAHQPTLSILELTTGRVMDVHERWRSSSGTVLRVRFSPRGDWIAYVVRCGDVLELRVLELQTGRTKVLARYASLETGLGFDAKGRRLAIASGAKRAIASDEVHLYEPGQTWAHTQVSLERYFVGRRRDTGRPAALALSPDGGTLALGNVVRGQVLLVDTKSGKELKRLGGPFDAVAQLTFDRRGKRLACVRPSGTSIALWECKTGKRCLEDLLSSLAPAVSRARFSRSDDLLALGYVTGRATVYRVDGGTELATDLSHAGRIADICFIPGKPMLLSAGVDGKIVVREIRKR